MRIAEKTVELNFCMGLPQALGINLFWFGLTQKQEAKAGFDACTRLGATLLLFQLKSSNELLNGGVRRFKAEHNQMQALRDRVKSNRKVFYVLPIVGTTLEPCGGFCFSNCSRYLDVSKLPVAIPQPIAKGSKPPTVRKNNCHYVDMSATLTTATIHSDPFEVALLSVEDLAKELKLPIAEADTRRGGVHHNEPLSEATDLDEFREFWSELSGVDRTGLLGAYVV